MSLEWIDAEIAALKLAQLWRTLRPLTSPPTPSIELDGQRLLLLCSNDYLGLGTDPRLAAAAAQAARRYGTGSGASRLVSGTQLLHLELERRLAGWKGTADCVLFSSGYLANLGAIGAVVRRGDGVVSDELNHASIIDGCRLSGAQIHVYRHADLESCEQALRTARSAGVRRLLLCTDGIFSMDGDRAPLPELKALAVRFDAMLLVDDAHGSGVLGAGRGAVAHEGLAGQIDLLIGTCSKALGSLGGFVAGSRPLCELLRNRARSFVFDTALPPTVLAATLCALDIIEAEPELGARVCAYAQQLSTGLRALGYRTLSPAAGIVPVLIGDSEQALLLSERLRQLGVLATAIRPPTVPAGTARIRLCPMATHTPEQVAQVLAAFAAAQAP